VITGTVNSRLELVIRLPVRDSVGQEHEVETILDTGFTGALTLPPSLIANFGLDWDSRGSALLANGSIEQFDIYAATVVWDGKAHPVLVQAIDASPLLGMELLADHDLRARVQVGGKIEIDPVP